jgi:hypothetical protein
MVNDILTKEKVQELMKIKGEVRGISLKADGEFILEKKGEGGLKKLETKLSEVGQPIEFKEIKTMNFYPLGLKAIVLLAIKDTFGFTGEDISNMAEFQSKFSLILKTFMKYFFSLERMIKESQNLWRKYYTVGTAKVVEFDEEKRCGVIRVEDFKLHPLHCWVLRGFFRSLVKMMVRAPVTCVEIECIFKGGKHHDFKLTW